jgi:anti-sigma factor ChrR (cupin superfamily)
MPFSACPTAEELQGYATGTISESDLERIADHVETRTRCEATSPKRTAFVNILSSSLDVSDDWNITSGFRVPFGRPNGCNPVRTGDGKS